MKKHKEFKLIAKTLYGLENVLAEELNNLDAADIQIFNRAVSFKGDKELMYKANLHLRTAIKILKPVSRFKVKNEKNLYDGIRHTVWTDLITPEDTFAVESVVNSQYFKHSGYVALKTKDAIVDGIREKLGARPSVDVKYPRISIHVHISDRDCTVSLDSSGETLHKRGYRTNQGTAPLNEILAAGLVLLTSWKGERNFIDPMCGSGTIIIEAAKIACNIPPNINRKKFGFSGWRDFNSKLWDNIQKEARKNITSLNNEIIGSDISEKAFRITKENIKNAGLENAGIRLMVRSIKEFRPPKKNGVAIMNPPYDERLKKQDINDFYRGIGDALKKNFTGYEAWIISSNTEALKYIGLRPSQKITLFNGPLKAKFQKYEIYEGSHKNSRQ